MTTHPAQRRTSDNQPDPALTELAITLVQCTSVFTRTVGRVPGTNYSSVAWRLLADLEREGPARVTHLAEWHRVAQPTMTALVHRLEHEGWVRREADPSDGRASLVCVTQTGTEALQDYRRQAAARILPQLQQLSESDRAVLARASEILSSLSAHV